MPTISARSLITGTALNPYSTRVPETSRRVAWGPTAITGVDMIVSTFIGSSFARRGRPHRGWGRGPGTRAVRAARPGQVGPQGQDRSSGPLAAVPTVLTKD